MDTDARQAILGGMPLYDIVGGGALALWEWRQSLDKQVSESRQRRGKSKW